MKMEGRNEEGKEELTRIEEAREGEKYARALLCTLLLR